MIYDLNVPWTSLTTLSSLERTIIFLSDLGYQTLAISYTQSDQNLPTKLSNPLPKKNLLIFSPKVNILHRCTFIFSDPNKNHRLPSISPLYDILAIRPTNEKSFLAACLTITEHSIVSLDLTIRYPFYFKPKPLMTAVNRGIKIEICYSQCINADTIGRRNFISNALSIIRCTKGRGLVVSSEAANVLACRGVQDIVNLLGVWGLNRERAVEGLEKNPRSVVVNEGMKRTGFRGVIDIVENGSCSTPDCDITETITKGKRPLDPDNVNSNPSISSKVTKKARVKQPENHVNLNEKGVANN